MINDDLRTYVRENMQKGFEREVLRQTLVSSGWDAADVETAFQEFDANTGAQSPQAQMATVATADASPQAYAQSPRVDPTSARAAGELSEFNDPIYQTSSSSKLVLVGAIVAGVVLFGGAAAAAYYFIAEKSPPSPEVVLTTVLENMSKLDSYAFDMNINMNYKGGMSDASMDTRKPSPSSVSEGTMNMRIAATGTVIVGESATTTKMNVLYALAGNVEYGAISMILDGETELRTVNGIVYVRPIKFPKLVSMLGLGSMLTQWEGKWISIDPKETSTLSTMLSSEEQSAQGEIMPTDQEQAKAKEILKKNWPIIVMDAKEKSAQVVGGSEVYHYLFSIDKEKLRQFMLDILAMYPERAKRGDIAATKEEIDMAVELFGDTSGEIFVGKTDMRMHRIVAHFPMVLATSSFSISGSTNLVVNFSQFDSVAPITAPIGATTIEKVVESMQVFSPRSYPSDQDVSFAPTSGDTSSSVVDSLTIARTKSRDAMRISDISNLHLALELYFDANQKYPTALNSLVPAFIPAVPTDALDRSSYYYSSSFDRMSFQLGASLERSDNIKLASDADGKMAGKNTGFGSDAKGCRGEKERHCYDIAP